MLLESTDMSVREIAERLAFNTVNYFIQSFRETAGCTPRAIPKAAQERIKSHPRGNVAGSPNMTKARRPDSGAARRLLLLRVRGPRRGPERQELLLRAPSPPGWHKTTDRKEPAAPFFEQPALALFYFFTRLCPSDYPRREVIAV